MGQVKEMRASDRAYAILLKDIQSGALPPGSVLGEVEQAARLGVSRTPMREAIGRLVADGLAHQQSPRVTAVTGFDADDIRRLFEARRALEEAAVRLAAKRGRIDTFANLSERFTASHPEQASADDYYALIGEFDRAVDAAVDNSYLVSAMRVIRTHLVRARALARDNQPRLAASAPEHALIAHAIAERDAELAAHAMHVHLHNALTAILNSLKEGTR